MPRAIFPAAATAGVLPFLFLAELQERSGLVLAAGVPVSVWPARSSRNGAAGRHHTHQGECALEYAQDLREPNRVLELGPDAGLLEGRYVVVSATPMEFMAHVVLELNLTSGKG